MTIRRKHISGVVNGLLRDHKVRQAPVPVERIAKQLGAQVQRAPADDDLSGFILQSNKQVIIGVNQTHSPNRQTFTIAHELGHWLLHNIDEIHVDRSFRVKLRNKASSKGEEVDEIEANVFAAELLMPASFISHDLNSIEHVDLEDEKVISSLARRYGVSVQAMTFRLSHLGYVQM